METLAEMMARYAGPGRVEAIHLRSARGVDTSPVQSVHLGEAGLAGDHGRKGKRAVTLIQAEHLPVIAALAGREHVDAALLRRNIVVSGLNLSGFRKSRLQIGEAVIELTVPCHPCSRMEQLLGHGGYTAMRGHGGMCAEVVTPGAIQLGDRVIPVDQ
ncbi:MAG: MOSC domain-containing protein [Silicimonas sp.]|nr:MOSC domain-containing protein [Silicimonas sp.]